MKTRVWCAVAFVSVAVGGCGAGGGGGDSASASSGYSGKTTPAVVDSQSAKPLSEGSVGASNRNPASAVGVVSSSAGGRPLNLIVADVLTKSVMRVDLSKPSSLPGAQADETLQCGGGGSYTIHISINDVTEAFDGSLTFEQCKEEGSVFDGSLGFSGLYDINLDTATSMHLAFNDLNVTADGESFTLTGTVDATPMGANTVDTLMNLVSKNNTTGEVEKLEDFEVLITGNFQYVEETLTGRYFHPTFGYVDVSTLAPLKIYGADIWPTEGQLLLKGDHNSQCKLTVLSNTQYMLEVDEDGDGTFEFAQTENW